MSNEAAVTNGTLKAIISGEHSAAPHTVILMARELVRRRKQFQPDANAVMAGQQSQIDRLNGKLEGAVAGLSARIAALEARPIAVSHPQIAAVADTVTSLCNRVTALERRPTVIYKAADDAPMRLEPGVDAIKRSEQ